MINDASCLIDLHKVELIEAMLQLPYSFVVALPVAHNEVLDFTAEDWKRFSQAGLVLVDLDAAQVGRAMGHRSQHAKLSAEDCFSLVLAQDNHESILLTGDAVLRTVASGMGCEVHGALWVTDEICRCGVLPDQHVMKCLQTWLDDDFVRLPPTQLISRLRAFTRR